MSYSTSIDISTNRSENSSHRFVLQLPKSHGVQNVCRINLSRAPNLGVNEKIRTTDNTTLMISIQSVHRALH